jgi:uncharacterized protein (TIGR03435 family)
MRMSRGFLILACLVFTAPLNAQAPAFEAASVRPTKSSLPGGVTDFRAGGQFTAENVTLLDLIRTAYNVEPYRLAGGPEWMRRDRFDVQARAGVDVSIERARLMLRTMLVERFMLRARIETRDVPTYNLVMSRQDGRLGPGLRPASPTACVDRGPMPARAPAGELPSCGLLPAGPERMSGRRVSLERLTAQLSSMTGRLVADRTGLAGMFDIDLEWAMTDAQAAALAALTPPGGTPPAPNPNRPGLFTAVEEQLGVKLQSSAGPVEVVVIESVDRPTPN